MTHTLTFYAPLAHVRQRLSQLAAGLPADIYARGASLNRDEPVVRLIAEALAAGQIVTHQRRDPQTGDLLHLFRARLAPDADCSASAVPPGSRGALGAASRAMLDLLAEIGPQAPCPSYAALAAALDLRDANVARYRLRRLRAAGWVRLRTETDVASGQLVRFAEVVRW